MADSKISQLPASTTPLAGTEVLPVVQSNTTKQVSVANLTAGRAVAAQKITLTYTSASADAFTLINTATSGKNWLFGGGTAGAVGDFGFYNSSDGIVSILLQPTGDVTLATGNIKVNTANKGINFTANTPAAGMTSQLLNWYEEGTFIPTVVGSTSAGTATYGGANGRYTRIGRTVEFEIYLDWSSGTGTGNLLFGGLPYSANGGSPYASATIGYIHNFTWTALKYPMALTIGTQVNFFLQSLGGGAISSMAYSANGTVYVSGTYTV